MGAKGIRLLFTTIVALLVLLVSGGSWGAGQSLVGPVTSERLFADYPSWAQRADRYAPKGEVIQGLKHAAGPIEVLVFLGTWCPMSVTEVPKFLKVYKLAENPSFSMKMYGVDPRIRDGGGLSEKHHVERVPTLVFLRNGEEIGRIVEYPKRSIEEDFWEIIKGS